MSPIEHIGSGRRPRHPADREYGELFTVAESLAHIDRHTTNRLRARVQAVIAADPRRGLKGWPL